jgi:acetyl-CoA carboxylase biotin carboxyl carrier protein
VAEGEVSNMGPFDVRRIRYLSALMDRYDMTEIDIREGDVHLRLRRRPRRVTLNELAAGLEQSLPATLPARPAPAATVASAAPPPAEAVKPAKMLLEIKSPTPGTFYASPKPDAEPFVKVGSRVHKDTVVCLIEAMKVFNEITADVEGVIVEVLVQNQQPVEYGQVLFKVDPTA